MNQEWALAPKPAHLAYFSNLPCVQSETLDLYLITAQVQLLATHNEHHKFSSNLFYVQIFTYCNYQQHTHRRQKFRHAFTHTICVFFSSCQHTTQLTHLRTFQMNFNEWTEICISYQMHNVGVILNKTWFQLYVKLHEIWGRTRPHYVPILFIQYRAEVPNMWAVDHRRSRGIFHGLCEFTRLLTKFYSLCQRFFCYCFLK